MGSLHSLTQIVKAKQAFERVTVSRAEALEMFQENKFKVELIQGLPEDASITCYRCGPMVDLCRGPHVPNTGALRAVAVTNASRAFWRADVTREPLQRVYAIAFPEDKELKEYQHRIEEAKKRDHRLLGAQQELFFFHQLSPGSCFFLPAGTRIYNALVEVCAYGGAAAIPGRGREAGVCQEGDPLCRVGPLGGRQEPHTSRAPCTPPCH